MATVLAQVGWRVQLLRGGYRSYRRAVVAGIERLAPQLSLSMLCGLTGSGKTALLAALQRAGGQVLDLEGLAEHRGSVLGEMVPSQPTQKRFESRLYDRLRGFDMERQVWVESESIRIGSVQCPPVLWRAMSAAECIWLDVPASARVDWLLQEYGDWLHPGSGFDSRLQRLTPMVGAATVARWCELFSAGRYPELALALLNSHYDPCYRRSLQRRAADGPMPPWHLECVNQRALDALASRLLER